MPHVYANELGGRPRPPLRREESIAGDTIAAVEGWRHAAHAH